MRVAVAGAAGRIGRVVCAGLAERGHEVLARHLARAEGVVTVTWATPRRCLPSWLATTRSSIWRPTRGRDVVRDRARHPCASDPQRARSDAVRTGDPDGICEQQPCGGVRATCRPGHGGYQTGRTPSTVSEQLRAYLRRPVPVPDSLPADRQLRRDPAVPPAPVDVAFPGRRGPPGRGLPDGSGTTYAVVYGISANTRGWWDLDQG